MKKINFRNEKGSFILELMVGLFLSSVTVLGVLYIYLSFETTKKSTSQLGKTIATAAMSLYPVQENIKMSGYGIGNTFNTTGCTIIKAYDSTLSTPNHDINVSNKPIDIVASGNNTESDQIIVSYWTSTLTTVSNTPISSTTNNNGSSSNWIVADVSPFAIGDMTLIYDIASPGTCIVQQITAITPITKTLSYSGSSTYNSPTGLGVIFPAHSTQILKIDMNTLPKTLSFQISNNQLTQTDNIYASGKTSVIGDNIVIMKAIFGLDKDADGAVETWTNTLLATDYQYIRGVKVAVLARSLLRERKELSGNNCNITTNNQFLWDNGLGTGIMDVSRLPDWKCYRYRMLQTTVPIKNLLWPNS